MNVYFSSMLKLLYLAHSLNEYSCHGSILIAKKYLSMRLGHPIPSTHFGHDRHTDRPTYIYHVKSRLKVWGSLCLPNYCALIHLCLLLDFCFACLNFLSHLQAVKASSWITRWGVGGRGGGGGWNLRIKEY